jgi:hypothetical protein
MTEPEGGIISLKEQWFCPHNPSLSTVLDTDNLYVAIRTCPNAPVFVCSWYYPILRSSHSISDWNLFAVAWPALISINPR